MNRIKTCRIRDDKWRLLTTLSYLSQSQKRLFERLTDSRIRLIQNQCLISVEIINTDAMKKMQKMSEEPYTVENSNFGPIGLFIKCRRIFAHGGINYIRSHKQVVVNFIWSSSASRQKLCTLYIKGSAGISPFKGFSHSFVEKVNEIQERLPEVLDRSKAASFKQASHENRKPAFNLIEPRGVFRRINKAHPVGLIAEEVGTGLHRF